MKIDKLLLENFRNHKELVLNLNGESALIVGKNGTGKTNILEAAHMLSTTKSLRATYDREVISHNEDYARMVMSVIPNGNLKELELFVVKSQRSKNSSTKKAKVDKVKKSLTDFAGNINSVLFTPHDVELFTQSPSKRRGYLDSIFYQMDKSYKRAHRNYKKAVRSRNKLLDNIREFGTGKDQLPYWDEKIIETGKLIQKRRKQFLDFVQKNINNYANKLNSQKIKYEVVYDKNKISKEKILNKRPSEIGAARTLVGPHRDDFIIKFNKHDISSFGSRGQKRTTILSLKLCEIDFINKVLGRRPILLLDDIFSELDESHKTAVTNIIGLQQTIITTADENDLKNGLKVIRL